MSRTSEAVPATAISASIVSETSCSRHSRSSGTSSSIRLAGPSGSRATKADGGWRISGQKIWTSRAQLAAHAILLARTGGGELYFSPLVEDLADFRLSLEPLCGEFALDDELAEAQQWLRLANQSRGTAIAGGSTFIQRNIVAERILGMPRG